MKQQTDKPQNSKSQRGSGVTQNGAPEQILDPKAESAKRWLSVCIGNAVAGHCSSEKLGHAG